MKKNNLLYINLVLNKEETLCLVALHRITKETFLQVLREGRSGQNIYLYLLADKGQLFKMTTSEIHLFLQPVFI